MSLPMFILNCDSNAKALLLSKVYHKGGQTSLKAWGLIWGQSYKIGQPRI